MKTIIKKSTGEYVIYREGHFYTSETPHIYSQGFGLEALLLLVPPKLSYNLEDYEVIEVIVTKKENYEK